MAVPPLTAAQIQHAREFWAEYQRQHDVSDRLGQAVGIDPISERVWFGESALDICRQLDAQGIKTPLLFLRVGKDYYWRKRSHHPALSGQ
jgi:hypothetical protein